MRTTSLIKTTTLITWVLCFMCVITACDDDTSSGNVITTEDASDTFTGTDSTQPTDTAQVDTADTSVLTDAPDTDTTPDPCSLCTADQVCVRNDTVTDQCFDAACVGTACGAGEVCDVDVCVGQACAGVRCDAGEVCLAGTCAVGSCASGQITCPGDQVCDAANDACVDACTQQSTCGALACVGGLCVPCEDSQACGGALVCDGGQCAVACTDDPSACNSAEACDPSTGLCVTSCVEDSSVCGGGDVCDPDTGLCATPCTDDPSVCSSSGEVCDPDVGLCIAPCTSDAICAATAELCDSGSGLCVAPDCTVNGAQAECTDTEICLDGRCFIRNPRFVGGIAGAAGESTSASGLQLTGVVGPAEITGSGTAQSTSFKLEAGMIMILAP
jgi:hypothetical protein